MKRAVAIVGATLACALTAGAGAVPSAQAATGGNEASPTMSLVAQPTGAELGGRVTFTVRVTDAPADAELDAVVFPPVDVAGLREARQGRMPAKQVGFIPRAPIAELATPDGLLALSLRPVDAAPRLDEEVRMGAPGVYPVRLRLLTVGGRGTLAELVTFVVRPDGHRLPLTVVLALPGEPSLRPDGTTAVAPADQARTLALTNLLTAHPTFPFALAPRPELLAALARTNPVLTARLAAALGTRTVLAMPFVRVDVGGLVAADLTGEVGRQLTVGEQAVSDALPGTRPDRRVWFVDGPLDAAALGTLRTLGVQHLLATAERLDPAPAGPVLRPMRLAAERGAVDATGLGVLVPDATTSAAVSPAAATNVTAAVVDLVAELSIHAFADEAGRGLVVSPPADFTVVPEFWAALASSLAGPSVLRAVGIDELLRTTVPARDETVRLRTDTARDELLLAQSLYVTRVALTELGQVLPAGSRRFDGLTDRTTVAASADLTTDERGAYFDAVTERVNPVRSAVTVRMRDRVTLAGNNGVVPLSLVNALDEAATVRVKLVSDKLVVHDNDQVVTVPARGETALRLEVEARSSAWRFPVTVQLWTPDGVEPLGTPAPLELRSVGLSGLGLGISFGALAVLATWWVTHVRRRRRKRRATSSHPTAGAAVP